MQIKAVTFDVGGTLIDPWPSVGHVYAEVAARHGAKNISADVLSTRFKAAWRATRDFNYTRAGWQELVELTFEGLLERSPAAFFPELYDRFARRDAWRLFDDVLPTLDALATRGLYLGIISNWDDRLHGLLPQLQLAKYFSKIVVSCDAGFTKPSPVIFELAATRLGLPPDAILHVGDSLELDVLGARSAGMQALRICRSAAKRQPGDLASLTELPDRLVISASGN
jgi:putative hydrolase of the HAD superfamily